MDLGWNGDFDSSLLTCWNENTEASDSQEDNNDGTNMDERTPSRQSQCTSSDDNNNNDNDEERNNNDNSNSWSANRTFTRLPSFTLDGEVNSNLQKSQKLASSDATSMTNNLHPSSDNNCSNGYNNNSKMSQKQKPNANDHGKVQGVSDMATNNDTFRAVPPTGSAENSIAPVSTAVSVSSAKETASSNSGTSTSMGPSGQQGLVTTAAQHQQVPAAQSNLSLQQQQQLQYAAAATQLHPLGIQSSANCPPHASNDSNQHNMAAQMASLVNLPNGLFSLGMGQSNPTFQTTNAAVSYAAGIASLQHRAQANSQRQQQQQQQQLQTQQQTAAASNNNTQPHTDDIASLYRQSLTALAQLHPHSHMSQPQQQQQQQQHHTAAASAQAPQQQQPHSENTKASQKSSSRPSKRGKKAAAANKANKETTQANQDEKPPPFYLFDAPIELRANFMQTQRKLGIPVSRDCNSYHYGEAVNGFHPQLTLGGAQNSQQLQREQQTSQQRPIAPVQLIDARHGTRQGAGRVKNEREQKRAQKITELIEQLRVNMETGGWKVEVRSKFHTLSSCADYVKHLMKTMKEKQENVDKLKEELAAKEREIEDKALQESRSDPESVTSSLTSSTSESRHNGQNEKDNDGNRKKRLRESNTSDPSKPPQKVLRTTAQHMSSSTSEESSGDGGGSGPGAQTISIDKTISTVSDITDSNRGSSSNSGSNSGSGSGSTEIMGQSNSQSGSNNSRDGDGDDDTGKQSSSSISSDAAVVSGRDSNDRSTEDHVEVVIARKSRGRKRPPEEITSLEQSFELDYEEVFDNSNIPQLIAATSGRIVTWNNVFLKATGLRKDQVERMTIFSFVHPDKLSNLFEIVAAALKVDEPEDATTTTTEGGEEEEEEKVSDEKTDTTRKWDYAAMTLPCIEFPTLTNCRSEKTNHSDPIYITVTLMGDKDPLKRCFHCVFTNCRGTNGALGSITPELLAMLFGNSDKPKKKKSRKRRAHNVDDDDDDDDDDGNCEQEKVEENKSSTSNITTEEFANSNDTDTTTTENNDNQK